MRPIRILQVVARMNVGGPASQVLAIAQGLDPHRFRVAIATGCPGAGEADYLALRSSTVTPVLLPGFGPQMRPEGDVRAFLALDRLVRRTRPDVIHTHTTKAGLLGRLVARRHGIPSVHTFHGHLLHGYFGPSATRAVVAVERWLATHSDRLVTVGEQVRDDLLEAGIGSHQQYTVVRPGVEPLSCPDQATARARLGLPADASMLAYVGRITAVKRPDRLLDSFARLRDTGRDVVLLVAGDGDMRVEVERQAIRQGLDVRFLGWRSDVGMVYGACDLSILTSDNEGMPVALVESALCRRPAVATDVGSVREVVQHAETGLLCRPDAVALADAVQELLDRPDRRQRMGERARAEGLQRFSTTALTQTLGNLYSSLVSVGDAR